MSTTRLGKMSRRQFVATASAVVAGGLTSTFAAPAIAQGTKIKMTLPWLPQGAQLFPFIARNKGFWSSRGIEVEIARGFGSGAAIQALSQGKFEVALVAVPTVLLSNAKGIETVSMGVAGYDITMGVMSLEDGPVKSVKDLEGRRLGSTPTSVEVPYIPPFLERSGVDVSKVNLVQVAANVHETSLINKQVDAISAVATSNMPNMIAQGIKFRFFPFSQQGVKIYANSFQTTPKYLAENRNVCEAWVGGLCDAIKFCMTNFDESVDIFLKEVPEVRVSATGKEFTRLGAGLFLATQLSPEMANNGVGWADLGAVEEQINLVMKFVAINDAKRPIVADTWTNDLVGKVKLSDSEMATAKKSAAEYAKLLSVMI